ncbi:MAG: asparagine synthase (glutamine-hydrolyzing) [Clostridium sp.]|nr:asparagine synthase (glutamine-hydrolyzing) [Clostridium sp.]
MCGIAGFVNQRTDAAVVIQNMLDKMTYRGPDGGGHWCDAHTGVTLGHRRLSIVDLSENGAQPMVSADGRFVMTYNGEIYNASEVKEQLMQARPDLHFRGTSDTEVMLEAFGEYGIMPALEKMKGMFAAALYDRQEKTITLVRDRVGEKPLYYGFINGDFVFFSDPAALQAYPGFSAEIDRNALALYMRYGFIPAPFSVYEGIYKLEAGCILTIRMPFGRDNVTCERYWSMEEAAEKGARDPFQDSEEEAADRLEELLTDAIRGQLISDVPVGAFLSGGTDSPLIVALMQKISKAPVKTFTIGFEEKKYNEAQFAKEIARHLCTEHTQLYVTEKELLEVIPKLSEIFTEPFADSSQIPTYLVSRLAKSKVTVALSGDAGDELFCGYNTYPKIAALYGRTNRLPVWFRRAGAAVMGMPGIRRGKDAYRIACCLRAETPEELHEAVCYHTDYKAEQLVVREKKRTGGIMPEWLGHCNRADRNEHIFGVMEKMMYKDMLTYHPDDILVKVDRAGMAVSLENRVPMLDRDVVEFSYRIPISYKYDAQGVSKKILKTILYRYVPKEMLDRPKKGFSVPLTRWLTCGDTAEWAAESIAHSKLAEDGYFDQKVLAGIWKDFQREHKNAQIVWEILMAEQWYQRKG